MIQIPCAARSLEGGASKPWKILVERIWDLKENLTAYDAAYVALAEALDARPAQAPGHNAAVELYP